MSKKSKLTLLIDGNWLLMSRHSVLNNKFNGDEETKCKELQLLMLKSINIVLKMFPDIDNIIFISDGGSWRTLEKIPDFIEEEYKGNRHLPEDVNWELVFNSYEELIENLSKYITTCKEQYIEGDDWCWYWSNKLNQEGTNVIIWSMDKDLTQLVKMNDQNGVFTVCWSSKLGLTYEEKEEVEEDPLQFFFNDLRKEYNLKIFNNLLGKCKPANQINPNKIVLDKIIRGDKGDNIFPIILKKSNNETSQKTFRVSVKDIDFDLDYTNDEKVKEYIHNLLSSKKYLNKVNKSEEDVFEHFKYNYKLVVLDEKNYPQEILDKFLKYNNYSISNNINESLSYFNAKSSGINSLLDTI